MSGEALTPMRCQEFVEVVTEYLERQMSEARMLWTEEHLALCDPCRVYLEQMTETIQALRGLAEESVSEETMALALQAFRAERPSGH
jgi:predicted anti-sigma-YlaC factor YlaD